VVFLEEPKDLEPLLGVQIFEEPLVKVVTEIVLD
jgi:hypothetical protein